MQITYRVSEQDHLDARALWAANETPKYRRVARRLLPWIGASNLIVAAFFAVVVRPPEPAAVALASLVGIFLLYCGLAPRRYFRKAYAKDHRFRHDFTAEISDDGIHVVTPFSDGQMKWTSFIRFLESEEIFMVFISESIFIIFPKRGFGQGEADRFRSLLRQNVAPPS